MSDPWPPPAPDIEKAFKEAHDAKKEAPPQTEAVPVTKAQIEALEKQQKQTPPQQHLTPPGVKRDQPAQQDRAQRIAAMKEKLNQNRGKARDAFLRER